MSIIWRCPRCGKINVGYRKCDHCGYDGSIRRSGT